MNQARHDKLTADLRVELAAAAERADRLFRAIEVHHRQKADDRCFMDDAVLYAAAGLPLHDARVGDKFEMMKSCAAFIDRRCEAGGWPTYAELQKNNLDLIFRHQEALKRGDELASELATLAAKTERLYLLADALAVAYTELRDDLVTVESTERLDKLVKQAREAMDFRRT